MTRKLLYGTIFLSAALLFLIQPLFAKLLLPFFGGSTSVWIISIFFYSATLLAGYVYASLVTKWSLRAGRLIHGSLLVLTGLLLLSRWIVYGSPVAVTEIEGLSAAFATLVTLFYGVGLPVLLLASTSVIVQHLFALHTKEDPYWLYTLSNAGSLLGLAVFPFLLEPFINLSFQVEVWAVGFVAFVFCLLTAWQQVEQHEQVAVTTQSKVSRLMPSRLWIIWIAAIPTFFLASLTDLFSRGIASFPMLWVIPLMLYLLSFVVVFRNQLPRALPPLGFSALVGTVVLFSLLPYMNKNLPLFAVAFGVGMIAFFLITCHLHRLLYEQRPDASQLGSFYVWLTVGGALGSGVVGLVLPFVLDTYIEVYAGLLILAIHLVFTQMQPLEKMFSTFVRRTTQVLTIVVLMTFGYVLTDSNNVLDSKRNFYGVVRIEGVTGQVYDNVVDARVMVHGTTIHGLEAIDDEYESSAVSYYGPGSGIELSMRSFLERNISPRINVIGLGVGMMNTYCEAAEQIDYIEINQLVLDLAEEHFSYLSRCPDNHEVFIGDGRIVLERSDQEPYDIIMVDAFSDDAIPVHLLTKEAFQHAYQPQLSDEGVVVVHISNKYLNLHGPVAGMVNGTEYEAVAVANAANSENRLSMSTVWVVLAKGEQLERIRGYETAQLYEGEIIEWTDARNSILTVLDPGGSRLNE